MGNFSVAWERLTYRTDDSPPADWTTAGAYPPRPNMRGRCARPGFAGSGQDPAICLMSLNVAKTISIRTSANPIRNPMSWDRSDNGRPRAASIP